MAVTNNSKLFVGNLPFNATSQTLEELFSPFGQIKGAKLVQDRVTRKPRGFGFVTFVSDDNAEVALKLNGKMFQERALTVRRAVARGTGSLKDGDDDENDEEVASLVVPPPTNGPTSKKPCRFLSAPGGCKNGTRCRFAHSMNGWSGPGGAALPQTSAPKPPAQQKAPGSGAKKATAEAASAGAAAEQPPPGVPSVAAAVAQERLEFMVKQIEETGQPSPAQLGAFLRTVVAVLASAVKDVPGAGFDMEAVGWDFAKNRCSAASTAPPTAEAVMAWLASPVFTPAKEAATAHDFNRRSAAPITDLLQEYGAFDPDWKPPPPPKGK